MSNYTLRQGQFLAFIYYYTKLNGQARAERDTELCFRAPNKMGLPDS
jgi:hypothetical protein